MPLQCRPVMELVAALAKRSMVGAPVRGLFCIWVERPEVDCIWLLLLVAAHRPSRARARWRLVNSGKSGGLAGGNPCRCNDRRVNAVIKSMLLTSYSTCRCLPIFSTGGKDVICFIAGQRGSSGKSGRFEKLGCRIDHLPSQLSRAFTV